MVSELPLSGQPNDMPFQVEGRPPVNMVEGFDADFRRVNEHYFAALRIPLLRGRNFTEQEVRQSARVLVVSELLVSQVFPDEDPIGKRLVLMMGKDAFEIIGISGDIRHRALESQPFPAMYMPAHDMSWTNLVIRTRIDPMSLAAAVRKEIQSIDPDQPVATVRTMEQWLYSAVAAPRYRTVLLGLFAAVALLLAAVGIYGVISYTVSQRTNEIGIRLALGARRSDVLKLIVGRGMTLALAGIGTGLAAAFGLTRLMSNLLFGVSATDLMTFAVCAVLLSGVALIACYVPARRATRVDPMVALRNE
jgi:putative ABC transport system permease protein